MSWSCRSRSGCASVHRSCSCLVPPPRYSWTTSRRGTRSVKAAWSCPPLVDPMCNHRAAMAQRDEHRLSDLAIARRDLAARRTGRARELAIRAHPTPRGCAGAAVPARVRLEPVDESSAVVSLDLVVIVKESAVTTSAMKRWIRITGSSACCMPVFVFATTRGSSSRPHREPLGILAVELSGWRTGVVILRWSDRCDPQRSSRKAHRSHTVDLDRELSHVVVLDVAKRLRGGVERVDLRQLDVERCACDELVQPDKCARGGFTIVRSAMYAPGDAGDRLDTVRPRDCPAPGHERELLLPALATGEHERTGKPRRSEVLELADEGPAASFGDAIGTEPFYQVAAAGSRCDGEPAHPAALRELHRDMTETAARTEDHNAVAFVDVELLEPLQGGDPRNRQRAGLLERDRVRHDREIALGNCGVLGEEATLAISEAPAVDP